MHYILYIFINKFFSFFFGKYSFHFYQYENKETKYFYIVKTPIKLFDDFNLDDKLKERISLIDLPGNDTINNKFNKIRIY